MTISMIEPLTEVVNKQTLPFDEPGSQNKNISRMPVWIRHRLGNDSLFGRTLETVQTHKLHTVCEEARCPNRGECWSRGTATFMLLGDTCTRACGFCSVKTGRPDGFDKNEPMRVAAAVSVMSLNYVVLTSVNRDDLADGGASIFADTLSVLRDQNNSIGVEFLTPDFHRRQERAIELVKNALGSQAGNEKRSLVWGHNIETVPRLYRQVRKGASYERSLKLLQQVSVIPGVESKTGIMLGLGESRDEVYRVLRDCRDAGVKRISIGQYLRPTMQHLPVISYVHPHTFNCYAVAARAMGFSWVKAGPLVRSSYHAEEDQGEAFRETN